MIYYAQHLRTLWDVFLHMFHRRVTVQYPDEKPYLAPRYRGRIILSRDPDGGERCVACYLCAVACPVDCIALAGDRRRARPPLSGVFPHQFLALHLLRILRGSMPDLRHPAHAGLRNGRIQPPEPGLRKGRPADQRPRQISRLQLLARRRRARSAAKDKGEGGARSAAGGSPQPAAMRTLCQRFLHLRSRCRRRDSSDAHAAQRRACAACT